MSFLNSLIKGFVRSAVNQVGRDAGRVVSNRTMKGRHAIPHTRVPSQVAFPESKPDFGWGTLPDALVLTTDEKARLQEAASKRTVTGDPQPTLPSRRRLTKNQLYGYALQIGVNADGEVTPGETDLASRLHTASARESLNACAALIREDIATGLHPLDAFIGNLSRHPEDVRLNALRLMAKVMLQDRRFDPAESDWFFRALDAAGIGVGRL